VIRSRESCPRDLEAGVGQFYFSCYARLSPHHQAYARSWEVANCLNFLKTLLMASDQFLLRIQRSFLYYSTAFAIFDSLAAELGEEPAMYV